MNSKPFARPWFYVFISCLLLLLCLSLRKISDFDLGYHLKCGQWMVQNRQILTREIFTFTCSDHPFLDIYWLYQILLYGFFTLGGYSLLTLINIGCILSAFLILWKRLKETEAPPWAAIPLWALAILACEIRFQVRPEIPTWIFLGLTLWVLENRFEGKKNLLYLLPFIQILWVNMHGLFPLGWAVMGVYGLAQWVHHKRIDPKLTQYTLLSLFCCLLNPRFIQGALFPFVYLSELRDGSPFKEFVSEFQSPWHLGENFGPGPTLAFAAYKAFAILLIVLLALTFRKRKLQDFLLSALFLYLSATTLRNISLFMIAVLPIAAACLRDLFAGRNWERFRPGLWNVSTALVSICLLLGLSLRAVTGAYYRDDHRPERPGLGLHEQELPVQATEFLVQNNLDGRIFNQLNAAGWLIWKGPQKVFIDGHHEVTGEDFFREYRSANEPGGLERLLEKYKIDIIFFNPDIAPHWVVDLQNRPEWRVAFLDGSAVVYVRKGYAPGVPEIDFSRLASTKGVAPIPSPSEIINAPRVSRPEDFWQGFFQSNEYPRELMSLALSCASNGHPEAAEPFLLAALQQTQGRFLDCYMDLGTIYFQLKRYNEAKLCMFKVLEADPNNELAPKVLAALPR